MWSKFAPALKANVVFAFVFVNGALGIIFFQLSGLFLSTFVSATAGRACIDFLKEIWCYALAVSFERVLKVRVVVTGDVRQLVPNESSLVLLNHRTRLDWAFYWLYGARTDMLKHMKVVSKAGLRVAPFFGPGMFVFMDLMLQRRWDDDKHTMHEIIDYFRSIDYSPSIMIFPEGSDLSSRNVRRSNEFAHAEFGDAAVDYFQVLHPRTRGTTFLANNLRHTIKAVHDVTIAYDEGQVPERESALFQGRLPRAIHFHLRRFAADLLPLEDEEAMAQWIRKIWAEKEELLSRFYAMPNGRRSLTVAAQQATTATATATATATTTTSSISSSSPTSTSSTAANAAKIEGVSSARMNIMRAFSVPFFFLFDSFIILALYWSRLFLLFFVAYAIILHLAPRSVYRYEIWLESMRQQRRKPKQGKDE